MMRFDYDPQLVEQAAFLAARREPERECELHQVVDPLYRIGDAELRQRAFRDAYAELFRRFGLERIVPACCRLFPVMTTTLERCIVREAERSRAQSVDLYREKVEGGERDKSVLIMALCPECLLDESRLRPWMYRQLQHVEDMLDPQFGYERSLPAGSTIQQNLVRDRYAALWDVYVEGRLIRAQRIAQDGVDGRWGSFSRAFTRDGRGPSRLTFEKLLNANDLTHARLMSWATQPGILSQGEGGFDDRRESAESCAVV